jgi:serine O-acetyltransferase
MFENLREDWATNGRDISHLGLWVMAVYRFGRWRYTIRRRAVRMPFSFLYKVLKVFGQVLTGVELPCEVTIGRRFRIEHVGAIVIHGDTVFGDDVIIRQGVTTGVRNTGVQAAPKIGNRVDIGAGAKILGPITIGDDVVIGANAVVLQDVPGNSLAVGVPARIIDRTKAELVARRSGCDGQSAA